MFETAKLGIPPAPELGRPIPTLSFAHANVVKPSVLAVVNAVSYTHLTLPTKRIV